MEKMMKGLDIYGGLKIMSQWVLEVEAQTLKTFSTFRISVGPQAILVASWDT